jgi:hypothetical protein
LQTVAKNAENYRIRAVVDGRKSVDTVLRSPHDPRGRHMARKNKRRSYDPFKAYCFGTFYWKAAASLGRESDRAHYAYAQLVIGALSLEVYLKCLHRIRRRIEWGHEIKKLFDSLSKADRAAITKHYEAAAKSKDIEAALIRANTLFTDARYAFEGEPWRAEHYKGVPVNKGANELIVAVRAVILSVYPEWQARYSAITERRIAGWRPDCRV